MDYYARVVENELRRLHEVAFLIPPGTDQVTLLPTYLVRHREWQPDCHPIRFEGLPGEQGTMFFMDPSGNPLEFKAFQNVERQLFET